MQGAPAPHLCKHSEDPSEVEFGFKQRTGSALNGTEWALLFGAGIRLYRPVGLLSLKLAGHLEGGRWGHRAKQSKDNGDPGDGLELHLTPLV